MHIESWGSYGWQDTGEVGEDPEAPAMALSPRLRKGSSFNFHILQGQKKYIFKRKDYWWGNVIEWEKSWARKKILWEAFFGGCAYSGEGKGARPMYWNI